MFIVKSHHLCVINIVSTLKSAFKQDKTDDVVAVAAAACSTYKFVFVSNT